MPFTVKENIDLAGTPTTQAIPALAEAVAPVDAPQVERLRAAGVIPIGRTNLPDFGLRVHTDSALHGLTRNPWNPQRTAGGSSGGEAAALATGMSPLGLGNDLGGSLRNPAHCCGIASIKPSLGAVPAATVIPPEDFNISFQLMAVEGVMARQGRRRPGRVHRGRGRAPARPAERARGLHRPGPRRAAGGGRAAGAARRQHPPRGRGGRAPGRRRAGRRGLQGHRDRAARLRAGDRAVELDPGRGPAGDAADAGPADGRGGQHVPRLRAGSPARQRTWPAGRPRTPRGTALARRWSLWYQEYPLLLSPVWSQPAFPLDYDIASAEGAVATLELMRPVLPANLLGTPAAVVPAGMADGLPVGVQVMGARYTDLRCLAVAGIIEQRLGPITPIDPVTG